MQTIQLLINQLVINTLLLLALTYVYSLSRPRLLRLHLSLQPLIEGGLFALVAIIGMALPPTVSTGVILDARAVIIGVAGLYGGLQTVAVAALLSSLFRILLGGVGAASGVGVILTAAALGYGLYLYRKQRKLARLPILLVLVFGFLLGLQHLLWVLALPAALVQETLEVLVLPALLVYPLSTLLLSLLLEHEQQAMQLRDALAFSNTALKNCADGIIVIDASGAIQMMNFATACMFGYAQLGDSDATIEATMKGRPAVDLIKEAHRAVFTERAKDALTRTGQQLSGDVTEVQGLRADHSTFPVTVSFGAFEHQNFIGVVIVSRDVTTLKEMQVQTRELDLEHQRVDVLQRFIGDASHDLRTPIAALSTSAYLMGKYIETIQAQFARSESQGAEIGRLSERVGQMLTLFRERLHNFNDQIEQLKNLINDLLDMARLESSYQLERSPQDMDSLLREVIELCRPSASECHLTLTYEPALGLPPVWVHAGEIRRVLNNLLTNAIHYTPACGSVTVRTRTDDDRFVAEVSDSGIGISEAELPHIFDRLYRSDRARQTYIAGTGLGLTIVKKIIEAHDGTIQVRSVVDQGTTFTVALPLSKPETGTT